MKHESKTSDDDSAFVIESGRNGNVTVNGRVRVQWLAPALVRLEAAGADGRFVDAPTFAVTGRAFAGVDVRASQREGRVVLEANGYRLTLGPAAEASGMIRSATVHAPDGACILDVARDWPRHFRLPGPAQPGRGWILADAPRVLPPVWGALPAPDKTMKDSGWTVEPDATDVYLFLHEGRLSLLRELFLQLTGRIPLPPRWMLGCWTSRYYPYSEASALEVIDRYRELGIPLDAFVLDTDWRVGASRGYEIDTALFPDMARFLRAAHDRNVRVMFNDHPEPKGLPPLEAELFQYRYDSLTRLLGMGLDGWWFDRNWGDIIAGPVKGLETAVWGQRLYYDIAEGHRPAARPAVLSMRAEDPASHRFPIHWTGDIVSDWDSLREAMRQTLEDGLQLLPWTGQDIGGHVGFPSPERYARWVQWGCLSPTMRLHCGPHNRVRYPWAFGEEALEVARTYIRLRYRLMPLLYTCARRAHDDGTPLLRRLDWEYPEFPDARRNDQYLLGDDLLVAPLGHSDNERLEGNGPLEPPGGFHREVFAGSEAKGDVIDTGWDRGICLDAGTSSALVSAWGRAFSVRWRGELAPAETGWYRLQLSGNGRKSLQINDEKFPTCIPSFDQGGHEACLHFEGGKRYPIVVTFQGDGRGMPVCRLEMYALRPWAELQPTARGVWIPPGCWQDVWTGALHQGPCTLTVSAEPAVIPLFARMGGIIPLAPDMPYTGAKQWDPLTLDVRPPPTAGRVSREIYEDDGESTAYLEGACRRTAIHVSRDADGVEVVLEPPRGTYDSSGPLARSWRVRVHLLKEEEVRGVGLDDRAMAATASGPGWRVLDPAAPRGPFDDAPPAGGGPVVEVELARCPSAKIRLQTRPAAAGV